MKRSIKSFAAAAVVAAALAAPAAAQEKVVVYGLKGPSGVGMVRLFEAPPAAAGYEFSAEALPGADVMVAKLVSGEAKIGVLPPNVAAKLAAAGRPLSVAAVVGNGMLSLLSADPAVASLRDLKGRSVEVAGQGATPDYVFRRALAANGLEPEKDVKLGYSLAYPEIAQALVAGKVSFALLPEPFATMARAGRPSLREVADVQAEWSKATGSASYPMTVLVVDRNFAAENAAAVRAVLEAYRASIEAVKADPAAAGALAEKHGLGLKSAVVAASVPRSAFVFIPARTARADLEALYAAFLAFAPASIGGKLPADDFYLAF